MSRDRFKAVTGMLHVVDPGVEDGHNKLQKVPGFLQFFKKKCNSLHQPFQCVAIDERIVKMHR